MEVPARTAECLADGRWRVWCQGPDFLLQGWGATEADAIKDFAANGHFLQAAWPTVTGPH